MKLFRSIVLSALMLTAGIRASNQLKADCLTCPGVSNDGWCFNQECQLVIIEGWECNRYDSEKGKYLDIQ